jgi:hypothetical protein
MLYTYSILSTLGSRKWFGVLSFLYNIYNHTIRYEYKWTPLSRYKKDKGPSPSMVGQKKKIDQDRLGQFVISQATLNV